MAQITVTTGYGYYVVAGKKVAKYELPLGTHNVADGTTIIETSKPALDGVILDKDPYVDTLDSRLKKIEDDIAVLKAKP